MAMANKAPTKEDYLNLHEAPTPLKNPTPSNLNVDSPATRARNHHFDINDCLERELAHQKERESKLHHRDDYVEIKYV